MRIGVHCFPLKASIGGMKQYFLSLFGQLLEEDRENEYVFFHSPKNVAELNELPSQRWRAHAVELTKTTRVAQCLRGLDLYFSPFCVLIPRPLPLPTVVTIPDNQEVFYPEFFSEQQRFARECHYRGSARVADRVLTISMFSKNAIAEHYGINPGKIGVAPLCADPRFFRAAEIGRRPDAPIPENNFLFYPANRWKHKNHDALLRALRILATEKGLRLHLVLTGHDVEGGYPVARMAAEYGLTDQVHSAGYVGLEELAWLYTHARMTLFPSMFEGFGLPLVEAMAAGCPLAVSQVGSLPEVGGDAVEYFAPGSAPDIAAAIARIYNDPQLCRQLVERGRNRASAYSGARLAAAHLEAFEQARAAYRPLRHAWNSLVRSPYDFWRVTRKYRHCTEALKR